MPTDDDLIREEIELLERRKAALENRKDKGIQSSRLAGIILGINQGATFGFADEIGAGLSALAKTPFNDKSLSENYAADLELERARVSAAQEQFPGTTLTGTVLGGIGTGVGAAKAAPQALANIPRLPRIAGVGAAEGALFGAGTAEEDRLEAAGTGAVIGAVAAPVASGGLNLVGKGMTRLAQPIIRAASNTPERQARNIVNRAVELDELGPASVRSELDRLGPEATLADLGENLSGLARGVTAKPGRARTIAANLLHDRQGTQKERLLKAAGVDFDLDDFKKSFFAVMNQRKSAAAPLYDEAYAQGLRITPELGALLKRPIMRKVLKKAQTIIADEGGQGGHVRLMDAAKRELDDKIGAALRSGKKETARRLLNIKNDLLAQVDEQVPSYKQARDLFSSEAASRDAANLGRSMFSSKIDLDDIDFAVGNMPAGEIQAFQMGAIRGIVDKLDTLPESRNAAQKLIESPRARGILKAAFPDEASLNKFLQTARAESQFSFTKNRVLGGSPTARITEEVTDLTKEANIATALRGGDAISMGIQFLRSVGMGDVSDETLEHVAMMLFSGKLPKQSLGQAVRQSAKVPEVTRQTATAGGVGALVGQREEAKQ